METKRSYYWLWAAVGLLLCLNLLTIGWVVWRTKTVRTAQQLSEGLMVRQLEFSPQQMKQYRQHRLQLRQQMKPHEDSLRALRAKLLDRTQDAEVTDEALNQLTETMARQNKQILRIRFRHWQRVRALCLPSQQGQFDRLIRRVGQAGNNAGTRGRLRDRAAKKTE